MITFEQAWAAKVEEGYQYGEAELELVRLGWEMRNLTLSVPVLHAVGRMRELEDENFTLAAGVCVVPRGLVGDEGGTPYCTLERKLIEITAERDRAREALVTTFNSMTNAFAEVEKTLDRTQGDLKRSLRKGMK